ncbi:hypothetical protein [Alistipes sp. An54]|uniref:hypothetical protein n=1 Tax=Alistipes sp. An54 TaxID=1965645 RepID=UPI001177899E|nr:hypothetical protein [Alistipes sp. An54]
MKKIFPSGLRILTWVALSAALITASCNKDDADNGGNGGEPTPPPVSLTDQFEYDGGDPIDIKSVVYEIDENDSEVYHFYLSPSEGISTVKGMENAGDYLKIVVKKPHGEVDTASEDFSVAYRDISVNKLTLATDVEKIQLSTRLLELSNQFVLYLDVTMKSGKTLLARYNNECVQYKLPVLSNQYALDDAVRKIGSIVEWVDLEAGTTTYYLYEAAGVTGAPATENPAAVTIELESALDAEKIVNGRLTAGSTLEIDFSTADLSKVSIQCGEFETAEGTTGKLTLKKDRGDDAKLSVSLDIENADSRLRADYDNNTIGVGYASTNHMTVTVDGATVKDVDLTTIYRFDNQYAASYQFALGVPDPDAAEPQEGLAGLTTGGYAVQLNIASSDMGKTFDLATDADKIGLFVYDYGTYTTYDPKMASGQGATGTVRAIAVGMATYYVRVDVQFPTGPSVKAEWYGTFTRYEADMTSVLTPVMPYKPQFVAYAEDGSVVNDWEILKVQVRHQANYSSYGSKANAYFFYFVTPQTAENGIDSTNGTPVLCVQGDYSETESLNVDIDALHAQGDKFIWEFKMNNRDYLGYTEYGFDPSWSTGSSCRCPDVASVSISKDGSGWNIEFSMKDQISAKGQYSNCLKNTIYIQYKGKVTKYTGTQSNDLPDSFYN